VFERANMYMSHILGIPVEESHTGIYYCGSERRFQPEEGYGMPWGVVVLRRKNSWWISSLPSVAGVILPLLDPSQEPKSGFSDKLIEGIEQVLCSRGVEVKSHPHALCFIPADFTSVSCVGVDIRSISESDDVSKFGYGIPVDSIDFGSAFGAFVDEDIIGYAEATPLPTVTDNFGIMPVGIEVIEKYRRQGIAHSLLATLTNHILSIGKLPWYHCSATNIASQKTAESCGYVQYGEFVRFQF
jgi:GNAT superfamily N-acetyltransferase